VNNKTLKVSKKLRAVTLWVHPEGRVVGSLYLKEQGANKEEIEQPLDVLNQCNPFLVFKIDDPDELRFYNIKSVTRVEYKSNASDSSSDAEPMNCHLRMMDGSIINGGIFESLPPDRSRLLDYLNRGEENFIKVHLEDGLIYLINKSYINHVHVTGIETTKD
jgi:hypothetical protein